MRSGTVLHRGKSGTGLPILVRYPTLKDVAALHRYINMLSKERTYILAQGQQFSYAAEKKFLRERLLQIKENCGVMLLVFSDATLIGVSGINLGTGAKQHIGDFGISIARDFRGQGIGTLLMQLVLSEAKKRLKGMKIIMLGVFAKNPRAITLYKKFGFRKYGSLPKGLLHRGKFIDEYFMYRRIE